MSQEQTFAINDFQRAVLKTFAHGEFSHLADLTSQAEFDREVANCGDGLLRFLLVELSTSEDCTTGEEAAGRIETAIRDLSDVLDAVQDVITQ